jgi:nucleoside-diphosphate-sugar epimerase
VTWHNTHILVTGAGGFICNHLVERLLGEGARVRAFVRYNGRGDVDHLTREPCPEIVAGDLRDSHAVSEAMRSVDADKIAESFHLSFGLLVVTLRPFNTFGPRQSARAVIPTIITQALTRDVVELGDLTPTRDLTYITDTVDGFVRAATAEGVMGQTINLGHRDEISIGDLAQRIIRITRRPVKLASAPERFRPPTSKVRRLYADNRKAKVMLDWSPRVSLDDGLRATVAWMADHLDHYRPNKYAL